MSKTQVIYEKPETCYRTKALKAAVLRLDLLEEKQDNKYKKVLELWSNRSKLSAYFRYDAPPIS